MKIIINNLRKAQKSQLIRVIRHQERAIIEKCYDCMAGQKKIDCQLSRCPLYVYRPWNLYLSKRDFQIRNPTRNNNNLNEDNNGLSTVRHRN